MPSMGLSGVSLALSGMMAASDLMAGASTLALLNSLQTETDGFVSNWAQGNTGIVKVVDSGTPANDLDMVEASSQDTDVFANTSPSKKNVTGPDGNQRYAAHNLWLQSGDWSSMTFNADSSVSVSGNEITVNADNALSYRTIPANVPLGSYDLEFVVSCDTTINDCGFRLQLNGIGEQAEVLVDFVAGVQQSVTLSWTYNTAAALPVFGLDTRDAVVAGAGDMSGTVITVHSVRLSAANSDTTYLATTTAARYAIPQNHDASKHTTSTSNLQLTLGEKAVTLATSQTYAVGDDIKIWNADGFQMSGTVKSGSGTSYVFDIEHIIAGTGSKSSWHISPILGRLCEPAATNGFTYSNDRANAAWTKINVTITDDTATAPNGEAKADKIVEDSNSAVSYRLNAPSSISYSGARVTSDWIKDDGDSRYYGIRLYLGTNNWVHAIFDPVDGSLTQLSEGGASTFTSVTTGKIQGPDGWYRVYVTASVTGSVLIRQHLLDTGTPSLTASTGDYQYNGDGTSGLLIWNSQEESGSSPTSDIITVGSTVTRLADDVSKDASELPIGTTEHTVVSVVTLRDPSSSSFIVELAEDATNRIVQYVNNNDPRVYSQTSGQTRADIDCGSVSADTEFKLAGSYKADDYAGCIDGGTVQTDNAGGMISAPTVVEFGRHTGGASVEANGVIRVTKYLPRQVSDTDLQTETAA